MNEEKHPIRGHYIAVDIGGTHIRVGVYPDEGIEPIAIQRIKTVGKKGSPLERLIDLIKELWPKTSLVRALGVAAPGYLNPRTGIVITAPNIPGWNNFPLRQKLGDAFDIPILLGNDANLAALGEWRYGSARGHHNVLYLTISTGIGGGVIINDNLLLGSNGLAAELGHLTIDPNGPPCGCGHPGHLEAFASGTALASYVSEQMEKGVRSSLSQIDNPSAYDISLAAQSGDKLAKDALARAGDYLGIGLANLLHTFNPSIVVLGGGVSRSGSLIIDPLRLSLARSVISEEYLRDLNIVPAQLGDNAGLIGALALAHTSPI
jgi:glucokinase